MNYTEFMNAMLCEIRGQVDAQVRTELYTVTKNNGGILPEVPEGAAGTGSGGFHLQYLSGDTGEEDL